MIQRFPIARLKVMPRPPSYVEDVLRCAASVEGEGDRRVIIIDTATDCYRTLLAKYRPSAERQAEMESENQQCCKVCPHLKGWSETDEHGLIATCEICACPFKRVALRAGTCPAGCFIEGHRQPDVPVPTRS